MAINSQLATAFSAFDTHADTPIDTRDDTHADTLTEKSICAIPRTEDGEGQADRLKTEG